MGEIVRVKVWATLGALLRCLHAIPLAMKKQIPPSLSSLPRPLSFRLPSGLLPLDDPGIARDQARGLEIRAEAGVKELERPGETVPDGLGLTRHPAAPDVYQRVKAADRARHRKGRHQVVAQRKGLEVCVVRLLVHHHVPWVGRGV